MESEKQISDLQSLERHSIQWSCYDPTSLVLKHNSNWGASFFWEGGGDRYIIRHAGMRCSYGSLSSQEFHLNFTGTWFPKLKITAIFVGT